MFLNATTTVIYTLSYTTLFRSIRVLGVIAAIRSSAVMNRSRGETIFSFRPSRSSIGFQPVYRSEEHTSELQSRRDLVCRLLLEKKNQSVGCYLPGPAYRP